MSRIALKHLTRTRSGDRSGGVQDILIDDRGDEVSAYSRFQRHLHDKQGCSTHLTNGQAEQIVEPAESGPVTVLTDGVGLVDA